MPFLGTDLRTPKLQSVPEVLQRSWPSSKALASQLLSLVWPKFGACILFYRLAEMSYFPPKGGVNANNAARVLHGAVGPNGHSLAGVAVVSAIATSQDPETSAKDLLHIVDGIQSAPWPPAQQMQLAGNSLQGEVEGLMRQLFEKTRTDGRVVQQITNTVVQNDSANATLALSCSPISMFHFLNHLLN